MEFLIRLLDNFKRKITGHDWRPLVSKYVSFSARDIIWECRVTGERKVEREYRNFSTPFSISTTLFITYKEFEEILNGVSLANYPYLEFFATEKERNT